MLRPEPTDIILILIAAAIVFFGPKRIPEIARSLGSSIREFREGLAGKDDNVKEKGDKKDSDKS